MNKVITVIIKAKSTLTQFLCNVMSASVTPPGQRTVDGSGVLAQTSPLQLLLSPEVLKLQGQCLEPKLFTSRSSLFWS